MLAKARITQGHSGDFVQLPRVNTAFARNPAVFRHTRYMKAGYRGEVGIAQLVVEAMQQAEIVEATGLGETKRGTGGFGSTGVSDATPGQAAGGKA